VIILGIKKRRARGATVSKAAPGADRHAMELGSSHGASAPLLGGNGGGGDGVASSGLALTIDATFSASLPGAHARPPLDCTAEVAKSRGEHGAPPAPGDPPSASAGTDDAAAYAAVTASAFTPAQLSQVLGKEPRVLGAGAFGNVLAGALPDGRPVAVKQMELASAAEQKKKDKAKLGGGRADPYSGEAGFRLELEVLSKYVHPNLVQLIGHCIERKTWKKGAATCSIVLEFMAGGSLLERLAPAHAGPPPTAQERFDVAADVARALNYLHTAAPPLIHQDVKSDNILLAEIGGRLVAKVADFGTARIAPQLATNTTAVATGGGGGQTHHSTGIIIGTKPYMPAEYLMAGHISEKTDTFAFGVVLLELLTGRPPYDDEADQLLHMQCYDMLCDPAALLAPLLDARVAPASWTSFGGDGELDGRALWLCLIAKRCLETHVSVRGTMREATPKVVALAAAWR
jgi:hypothetical protein